MLEFFWRCLALLKKMPKPDVIYASSPSPLANVAGIILGRKLKVTVIAEVQDLWPEAIVAYKVLENSNFFVRILGKFAIKFLYLLEKWTYKNANQLIFTMEGYKEYILEKNWQNKVSLEKINHINQGVDLEEFEFNKNNFKLEDQDLLDKNFFKIIYVGSIRKVNHLSDLIDAAKIIEKKEYEQENKKEENKEKENKKIKFLVYGDGTEKESLEKRCKDENITNIKFKGRVDRKLIPFILSNGDANIIIVKQTDLMRFGSCMNKSFDYMASGKPTISNLRVRFDLLKKYGSGVTSKSEKAEDLVQSIEKIYNLPKISYKNMCGAALSAAKDYDYKILTNKLEEILDLL